MTFLGHVADRSELAALLASADVVLAPGPVETFGLAALEALACGTPVVASARSALPALIGPAGAVATTPAQYAGAVQRLLAAPAAARRARARARAELHPWSAAVSAFLSAHDAAAPTACRHGLRPDHAPARMKPQAIPHGVRRLSLPARTTAPATGSRPRGRQRPAATFRSAGGPWLPAGARVVRAPTARARPARAVGVRTRPVRRRYGRWPYSRWARARWPCARWPCVGWRDVGWPRVRPTVRGADRTWAGCGGVAMGGVVVSGRQAAVRFAVLGDSLSEGVGDPLPDGGWRGWGALLAAGITADADGVDLLNTARSGARTGDVAGRQLTPALAHRPHIASVVAGGNDTLRGGFAIEQVAAELHAVLGALRAQGADVLTACLPGTRRRARPAVAARPSARPPDARAQRHGARAVRPPRRPPRARGRARVGHRTPAPSAPTGCTPARPDTACSPGTSTPCWPPRGSPTGPRRHSTPTGRRRAEVPPCGGWPPGAPSGSRTAAGTCCPTSCGWPREEYRHETRGSAALLDLASHEATVARPAEPRRAGRSHRVDRRGRPGRRGVLGRRLPQPRRPDEREPHRRPRRRTGRPPRARAPRARRRSPGSPRWSDGRPGTPRAGRPAAPGPRRAPCPRWAVRRRGPARAAGRASAARSGWRRGRRRSGR